MTLFAFSSENWKRPQQEVDVLMELVTRLLTIEIVKLNEQNIKLTVIGKFCQDFV